MKLSVLTVCILLVGAVRINKEEDQKAAKPIAEDTPAETNGETKPEEDTTEPTEEDEELELETEEDEDKEDLETEGEDEETDGEDKAPEDLDPEAGAEPETLPTEDETCPTGDFGKDGEAQIEIQSGRLINTEVVVETLELTDKEGNTVEVEVIAGSAMIPQAYVKLGKAGYLIDREGNLVDFDGTVLTENADLASMLTSIASGEEMGKVMGVKIVTILDEGDFMPEEFADW